MPPGMTQMEVYAAWTLLAFAAAFCLFVVIKILLIGKRHKDEEAAMNDKEQVTEEEQLHILNDIQANLTNYAIKKYRVEASLRGVKPLDEDKSRNKP
jgi:glycerol-3-phosphate dehydrogenase